MNAVTLSSSSAQVDPATAHPTRLRAAVVLALAATLTLASVLVPSGRATADPAGTSSAAVPAGRYVPTPLTRVLDTRVSGGPFVGSQSRVVDTDKAISGKAIAVVFHLTVATPTGAGFVTAYPAGSARPAASNLNFVAGENRANMITVAVGSGSWQNDVSVYVSSAGSAQVIVDVVGYYGAGGVGAPVGTDYQPLATPVRLFDTRNSIGALTNTYPKNTGIVSVDYGSPAVNKTISALAMTLSVTAPTGPGWLTVSDGGPKAAVISWVRGQSIGSLTIVPVHCSTAACNTVEFYATNNLSPTTQLIGDIAGAYFTPSRAGTLFTPVSPVRVVDTRSGMGFTTLLTGRAAVADLSRYAGPGTAAAAVNVQSFYPAMHTWLTTWATGPRPAVTNLNSMPGRVDAIAAQVKLASNRFSIAAAWGPVNIVIDLAGTFAYDPSPAPAAVPGSQKAAPAAAPAAAVSGAVASS